MSGFDKKKKQYKEIIEEETSTKGNITRGLKSAGIHKFMEISSQIIQYEHKAIPKGGAVLSLLAGTKRRITSDLDLTLINQMENDDAVSYISNYVDDVINNKKIENEIEWQRGEIYKEKELYKVKIKGNLYGMNVDFKIEITFGENGYPEIYEYTVTTILGKEITFYGYTLENILAEKISTFFIFGDKNTRAKDFYDFYLIPILAKEKKGSLDYKNLLNLINEIFVRKNIKKDWNSWKEILSKVIESKICQDSWRKYTDDNEYADFSWEEIIEHTETLFKEIDEHATKTKDDENLKTNNVPPQNKPNNGMSGRGI